METAANHDRSEGMASPMVSVAITSYNSERWLSRAIDSVFAQQTDFPVEIVIGDDGSQDGTVDVARAYQRQHANIRLLARPKNIGIQQNYYDTFENCSGKYIAWLDADDYWTDPLKLSIQVATMEADAAINVCCHFVRTVSPEKEVIHGKFPSIAAGRYGLEEILRRDFVPSVSVVFRNGLHRKLPAWYFDLAPATDYPLWVVSALSGDIVLLDRVMADYVYTPGSAFSKDDVTWLKQHARLFEYARSILPARLRRSVRKQNGKRYEAIAYLLRKRGDFAGSREAALKALVSPLPWDNLGSKTKAVAAALIRETQWRIRGQRAAS